ncbi:MAG: hypothetical protein WCX48_04610, partial [Bacteroidales bacterium]
RVDAKVPEEKLSISSNLSKVGFNKFLYGSPLKKENIASFAKINFPSVENRAEQKELFSSSEFLTSSDHSENNKSIRAFSIV